MGESPVPHPGVGESRYVSRLEIVPAGESSHVCTASGRWFRVALPASRLAEFTGQMCTGGRCDYRDEREAAILGKLERWLVDDGSLRPVRPPWLGALLAVGSELLCRALQEHDGSGLLKEMRITDAAGLPEAWSGSDLTLFIDRGYSRMLDPEVAGILDGRDWLPCNFAENVVSIGPMNGPRYPVTVSDLFLRRTGAVDFPSRLDRQDVLTIGEFTNAELAWVASILAMEIDRYRRGEPCLCAEHELVLRVPAMTVTRHRVIPVPFCRDDPWRVNQKRVATGLAVEELVDGRTGIITRLRRIEHHPSIPPSLTTVQASITNARRFSPWLTDPVGAGSSFISGDAARAAAIGEAVERYSGEIVRPDLLCRATWRELAARGRHAVDPETLELFSARQHGTPGFPFVPLTRDLTIYWVRGRCLSTDDEAWLPASLVYPNWYTGGNENDPPTNNPFYPGLAAGPDLSFAIAAGIQEVIERDATMVWWANAEALPGVRPSAALGALWEGDPAQLGQRAWLIHLDNEFGVPVVAGVVENSVEQLFTVGFAARPDPADAALKAWTEALTLQEGSRDLLNPAGGYRQSVRRRDINGRFVKPYRADRRYLDDYREDLRDVVDLMCQLQMYLDPRAAERVRRWVDVPAQRELDQLPRLQDGSLRSYQQVVEARGYRIYYADVTTGDVEPTGMRVVRVLIPGMVPNFAAAFPFHGRGRLTRAAVGLGWRSSPLGEEEINLFPLPHA